MPQNKLDLDRDVVAVSRFCANAGIKNRLLNDYIIGRAQNSLKNVVHLTS